MAGGVGVFAEDDRERVARVDEAGGSGEGDAVGRGGFAVLAALGDVGSGHPCGEAFDGGVVLDGDGDEGGVGIVEGAEDLVFGVGVGVEEEAVAGARGDGVEDGRGGGAVLLGADGGEVGAGAVGSGLETGGGASAGYWHVRPPEAARGRGHKSECTVFVRVVKWYLCCLAQIA